MDYENLHSLKILPEYFKEVIAGNKTFEIRKNDRNFQVGDLVLLREYVDNEYTKELLGVRITYITNYAQKDDYIVFSFVKDSTIT